MPVNPSGMMFPFNGDTSGVMAAVGRCRGGDSGSCVVCGLVLWPSPTPPPRLPLLCSQAGQHLVNLIEGFVPSCLLISSVEAWPGNWWAF